MKKSIALFILTFICSVFANAETAYVTDNLEIMLRSGPGSGNRIVKVLKSGEKLEILQMDAGAGHAHVKVSGSNVKGYVLKRFVTNVPSAKSQVLSLQNQLQRLSSNPSQIQGLLATSQDENIELIKQNVELATTKKQVTSELKHIKMVSSNSVKIAQDNTNMKREVQSLLLQLDDIRIQNEALKDQSDKRWFILGALAVLLGLLLGWILSMMRRHKRNAW